ncbi:MAG TPA: GNAT family N-acetyltransferase, partial [Hellea balneolensis]|nr:GNAT family N-acetyltransferase [Hellea balneolensis]
KAQWLELWAGYVTYYRATLADNVTNTTWARMLDAQGDIHGLCAVDENGTLVGIVHYLFHPVTWAAAPRCYLEDLFTAKDARGQGVARALIEAVRQAALSQGSDQVYWLTEDYNERAQFLYDKVASKTPFIKYQISLGSKGSKSN